MNIANIQNVYFIGIGGIGMSALACWFQSRNCYVAGYDRIDSPVTQLLNEKGIMVIYNDSVNAMPELFIEPDDTTLIVYTPAIPAENEQLKYFENKGFNLRKRAEILGKVCEPYETIAVAGTHGKTTTAAMIAHLLVENGVPCYAFLGGIPVNYGTNFIEPSDNQEARICIAEADEYDRSFLQLHSDVILINSVDADHLDVYENQEKLVEAYREFSTKLRNEGRLICKNGLQDILALNNAETFDVEKKADHSAQNVQEETASTRFDYMGNDTEISDMKLKVRGKHNLLNAIGALAVASGYVSDKDALKKALASFEGLKRRFEYIVNTPECILIDDYAHHPAELNAVILSCRAIYPDKRITGIFQPHLFSRTRDFMKGFAESLSSLDRVILLDIYPAREKPIPGITSEELLKHIKIDDKSVMSKESVLEFVKVTEFEVLLTLGAGDIDRLVEPIGKIIKEKLNS